jgi:hypothetical protein
MALPSEYDEDPAGQTAEQERAESDAFERDVRKAAAATASYTRKFETDPEWLAAREELALYHEPWNGMASEDQVRMLTGIMSDYMTACLARRPPRSIGAYVEQWAAYQEVLG